MFQQPILAKMIRDDKYRRCLPGMKPHSGSYLEGGTSGAKYFYCFHFLVLTHQANFRNLQ
jgi:hypothetical protein